MNEVTRLEQEDLKKLGLKAKKADREILNGVTPKSYRGEMLDSIIVVLLDNSGSMASYFEVNRTKIAVAWESLKTHLVPNLAGYHFGIISFSGFSKVKWEVFPGNDAQTFIDSHGPVANGFTPMFGSLKEAWAFALKYARKARFILLSDGEPNDAGKEDILAEAGKHTDIPVDCVGIGVGNAYDYDPEFLRRISAITGGVFIEVHSIKELTTMLEKLAPVNRPLLGTVNKQLIQGY